MEKYLPELKEEYDQLDKKALLNVICRKYNASNHDIAPHIDNL